MPYRLGIDLGTTFTAAAICRPGTDGSALAELVPLGSRGSTVPSVLFLDPAGTTLVGDAAERRALTDPGRVVREFKRRLGDETPMLVGDDTHHAHDLTARLVHWVVDKVTEREGEPPDAIAVTHPASWGPHREALLRTALTDSGIDDVLFLTEPQAAAMQYASAERIEPGSTIAVYDLGGGTFDAAVVRKSEAGAFELLGLPEGIERLGGIDFDELILDRVLAEVPEPADEADPMVSSAMVRLRRECTEAKEALSCDTEATIPVLLPQARTQVRLVREEFEALIRSTLEDTVASLQRAVEAADVTAGDLTAVLLVGGSSRIPLVTQLISAELGRPVSVDADPKSVVAMGAALAAHRQVAVSTELVTLAASAEVASVPQQRTSLDSPVRPELDCEPPELGPMRRRYRNTYIALAVFVTLVVGLLLLPTPTALSNKVFGGAGGEPAQVATTDVPGTTSATKKSGGQGRSDTGLHQANASKGTGAGTTKDGTTPGGAAAAAVGGKPAGAASAPGQAAASTGADAATPGGTTSQDPTRDDVTPPSTGPADTTAPPANTDPPAETNTEAPVETQQPSTESVPAPPVEENPPSS